MLQVKEPKDIKFKSDAEHLKEFESLTENRGWQYIARCFWVKANYLKAQASSYPVRENNREAINEKIIEAKAYLSVLSMVETDIEKFSKKLKDGENYGR